MGPIKSCTRPGEIVIYRAWSTDKNGKRIYPKNGRRAIRIVLRKPL